MTNVPITAEDTTLWNRIMACTGVDADDIFLETEPVKILYIYIYDCCFGLIVDCMYQNMGLVLTNSTSVVYNKTIHHVITYDLQEYSG